MLTVVQSNLLHWGQLTSAVKPLPQVTGKKKGIVCQAFHNFLAGEYQNEEHKHGVDIYKRCFLFYCISPLWQQECELGGKIA